MAPLITWSSVQRDELYVAANNPDLGGDLRPAARGGLWTQPWPGEPPVPHPRLGRVAFVAPASSSASSPPPSPIPRRLLGSSARWTIPRADHQVLVANVALVVEWVKFRRRGIHKNIWLWVITPVVAPSCWPSHLG